MSEMTIEEARKITGACGMLHFWYLGLSEQKTPPALPDRTLEELCIANRMVREAGPTPIEGGGYQVHCHCDERLIAAMFARQHYRHDPKSVLQAMGWDLKD